MRGLSSPGESAPIQTQGRGLAGLGGRGDTDLSFKNVANSSILLS